MRGVFALLAAAGALAAGCGSANQGTGCGNLGADSEGIYGYVKQSQKHGALSPSEQEALAHLQHQAKEAIAACVREGRATTSPHAPAP
jgi:hypothetical protein